jgi:histidinol-phosphate phosphatase family protein
MTLKDFHIDETWALFLDRDGVINRQLPGDYVKHWDEFEFLDGVLDALHRFTRHFGKIFIATNQQGVGKGVMTETELDRLHDRMMEEIRYAGGRINKIYHSPYREEEKSVFRKPGIGMARKARIDYPEIDFGKSLMIGDSLSDMQFGRNAGMRTVYITAGEAVPEAVKPLADLAYPDLKAVADALE